MSIIQTLAEAVRDWLNDADRGFSQEVIAAVKYRPISDLKQLQNLCVSVVPKSQQLVPVSRSQIEFRPMIDIGVQRRIAADGNLADLLTLTEEIFRAFPFGLRLGTGIITAVANDPIYDPEHIDQYQQFLAIITLTFKVFE